jgi:predicted CoA-binding protein
MRHQTALDETVCALLGYRRIAVVGLSDKPWRDSYRVAAYMAGHGYEIVAVNPEIEQVFGHPSYPDLESAPKPVELVDVFRRPEHVPAVFDAAIRAGAKAVWTQYGLVDDAGAERARAAGLQVVMNRCLMVEHARHSDANEV